LAKDNFMQNIKEWFKEPFVRLFFIAFFRN
jgi:hypothetical protein